MPLEYFFDNQVALESPISMQACLDLSQLVTSDKDKGVLNGIGNNNAIYECMRSMGGLKWIGLFETFPSLSKQVTINFLICNMKPNHARSYSIASCKELVGSELHILVGR
jgi:sulfite reductase alpha subunit-like flavoprotein